MLRKFIYAVVFVFLPTFSSFAADLPVRTYDAPNFDWNGFFVGLGVGGTHKPATTIQVVDVGNVVIPASTTAAVKVVAGLGWNFSNGWLFRTQAGVSGKIGGGALSFQRISIDGRFGAALDDRNSIYAILGAAYDFSGVTFGVIGVGGEVAIADDVTLGLEVKQLISGSTTNQQLDILLRRYF